MTSAFLNSRVSPSSPASSALQAHHVCRGSGNGETTPKPGAELIDGGFICNDQFEAHAGRGQKMVADTADMDTNTRLISAYSKYRQPQVADLGSGCNDMVKKDNRQLEKAAEVGGHTTEKSSHEVSDRLPSILRLITIQDDIALNVYPSPNSLGDTGNLMHVKELRLGDEFLISSENSWRPSK